MSKRMISILLAVCLCAAVLSGCGASDDTISKNSPIEFCIVTSTKTTIDGQTFITSYSYEDAVEVNGLVILNGSSTDSAGIVRPVKWVYTNNGFMLGKRETDDYGSYQDYISCLENRTLEQLYHEANFDRAEQVQEKDDTEEYKLWFTDGSWMECAVIDGVIVSYSKYLPDGTLSEKVESNSYGIDTSVSIFNADGSTAIEIINETEMRTFIKD